VEAAIKVKEAREFVTAVSETGDEEIAKSERAFDNVGKAFQLAPVYEAAAKAYERTATALEKKVVILRKHAEAYDDVIETHHQLTQAYQELIHVHQTKGEVYASVAQTLEENARSCKICDSQEGKAGSNFNEILRDPDYETLAWTGG
jgi:ADP-glucose pyrophosphorylase